MGSDFNYESAEQYFINMDKIIAGVNRNGTIHAQYSTPSLYYKAKLTEGITWSTKTDDFFPCQLLTSTPRVLAEKRITHLIFSSVYRWDWSERLHHRVLHLSSRAEGL